LFLGLIACDKSTTLGGDLLQEDLTQIQVIDSLKIETSTLLLDSLYSGNGPRLLTGSFDDPYLGKISAQCFFNLDSIESFSIEDDKDLLYDSLTLSLRYDYQYPETDHIQKLVVNTLAEKLNEDVDKYYFNYSPGIKTLAKIGEAAFIIRKTQYNRVYVRLSDELGKALFDVAKNQDQLNISDVLKGLNFTQGDNSIGQSVLGFPIDSVEMRVYYHLRETKEEGSVKLRLKPAFRFNQIISDRIQTPLKNLNKRGQFFSSSLTNQVTYIQSGIGICTGITFPSLRNISLGRKIAINVAYLDIQPIKNSFQGSDFYPLDQLSVYVPTHKNTLARAFWSGNTQNPVNVNRSVDPLTGNSRYRIYLTDYINKIVNQDAEDYDGILLFANAANKGLEELGRVVLGSQRHPSQACKLHVIFTIIK
jgi:hypothetical protein